MKRRTLLTGSFWGSILAFVTPVRATSIQNSKPQPREVMSPYEAVKTVYDGFSSQPGTEFRFDVPNTEEGVFSEVFCKMISPAEGISMPYDVWLLFNERCQPLKENKKRELVTVWVLSKDIHGLILGEDYDVQEKLKSSWGSNGRLVASVKEFYSNGSILRNLQIGGSFEAYDVFCKNQTPLARFLNLITG